MDLFGPWPLTTSGNRYVCTITDLFSKFVYSEAMPSKEATSVAKVLVNLAMTYGPPKKIITDKGREFNNEVGLLFSGYH